MHKTKQKLSLWEHYLTKEIGIEFKACLYFFCILFFYCVYKLVCGIHEAEILHMTEMIFLTYFMGYIQVYLLSNFDEAEHLGRKEWIFMLLCTLVYTLFSYLFSWFDRNLAVSLGFLFYVLTMYLCAFMVYKSKRKIDEKLLNADLKAFQERGQHE
ncbi:MAG: DUF3021 domain-containing protein [Lachnospiraceae bacterium]|nr:DUF3021 domain-containing protein [Lachnospiraceae bacterium]